MNPFVIFNDAISVIVTPFMLPIVILLVLAMVITANAFISFYFSGKDKTILITAKKHVDKVLYITPILTGAFYGTMFGLLAFVFQFGEELTIFCFSCLMVYSLFGGFARVEKVAIRDRTFVYFFLTPMILSTLMGVITSVIVFIQMTK